jgi:hypothetical protein
MGESEVSLPFGYGPTNGNVGQSLWKRPGGITDEMKCKIDTPEGGSTYTKRLGIVEPGKFFGDTLCRHKKNLKIRK